MDTKKKYIPPETKLKNSGGERVQQVEKFHIYTVSKTGKSGKKISLRTNHFPMEINVPGGVIYHYDVDFTFSEKKEQEKEKEVKNRKLLLEAFKLFKEKYSKQFMNPDGIVFDGLKNVYTCKELKFPSREFEGQIEIKEDANSPQGRKIKIILKYAGSVDVNCRVAEYCRRGMTETKPYDAIQALNIVLSMTPKLVYKTVGRNYFNPNDGTSTDIGGGASLWIGTFTSVRLGWKPMLNVDVANTVGFDRGSLVEFIEKVLSQNKGYNPSHISLNDKSHFSTVNDKIKDLKICYTRPGGWKKNYKVIKMMPAANEVKLKLNSGEQCTVEKYFKDKYDYKLKFPHYPCLHVGKPENTVYLPIELCMLKNQALSRFKHIDDFQRKKMIRAAAKPPKERRLTIEQNLRDLSSNYDKDPYAKAFGVKVCDEMMKVEGRVVAAPVLKYKNAESKETEFREINHGKWLVGKQEKDALKFLTPKKLEYWGVLDLTNLPQKDKEQFVDSLYWEGAMRGMYVDYPIYKKANAEHISQVKAIFENLFDDGCVQLIMVIIAKKGPARDELKYLGDTILKVPTQFVLKANILGKDSKGPDAQVLHNLCLKINHKLGGVNHALLTKPPIMNKPVMVMGADVTHPAPSDIAKKPSIAAVVGSADSDVSQFNAEIRLQERVVGKTEGKSKGRVVEEIVKMEEITKSLLSKFVQKAQQKPAQIIYYRDGVSEGQFLGVLNHELSAIRRACATLERGYEAKVTFIIAQKRHKTRFFVENPNDGVGRTRNIPAGTVVDTEITTLSEIDFFLASHEGIQVNSL